MTSLSKSFMQSGRICAACFYLLFTLLSIPISFKVGGLECGLSFTVTLFTLYFITTTLNVLARRHGGRLYIFFTSCLYYSQHFIIASLLYLFLSGFSNDELGNVLKNKYNESESFLEALKNSLNSNQINYVLYYYYYRFVVQPWQFVLTKSTPFFTLSEGFFTILAIQAVGETNRWLSNDLNSNTWIISSLLTSGGVITASLYYLYRIYVTPIWPLSIQTASLLGLVLSMVCGLGLYGIVSQKGSVIESSLFFAYIVRCIYEISPKLATTATDEILNLFKDVWQKHQRNLPTADNLLCYFHNVILKNADVLWGSFIPRGRKKTGDFHDKLISILSFEKVSLISKPFWKFFKNFTFSVPLSINEFCQVTIKMASESVSPAIVINLCFRVLMFYSATRIIPALQRKNDKQLRKSRRIMKGLYWYSPCILIAMYTHLILQYSGELKKDLCIWGCSEKWFGVDQPEIIVDSWGFWNWCNIFCTILVYATELIGSGS
ncbi:BTE_collapsed_G0026660.mRNA.1.CDS.1 [Saccharomyces cerevisiae]|nr:BTE_collapsed_G0026660.mRNA.1.CDS.1 [Saccharomyces cerevisiae]